MIQRNFSISPLRKTQFEEKNQGKQSAEGRTRTGTVVANRGILSPLRHSSVQPFNLLKIKKMWDFSRPFFRFVTENVTNQSSFHLCQGSFLISL